MVEHMEATEKVEIFESSSGLITSISFVLRDPRAQTRGWSLLSLEGVVVIGILIAEIGEWM